MEGFRINEALAAAKNKGLKVTKAGLAARVFGEGRSGIVLMSRMSGKKSEAKMIKPCWVKIICDYCQCDANFLFGIEK